MDTIKSRNIAHLFMNIGKISSVPNETGASEVLLTFLQDVTTKIIVDLYESSPGIIMNTANYDIFISKGGKNLTKQIVHHAS
jgi:hypothetical protein